MGKHNTVSASPDILFNIIYIMRHQVTCRKAGILAAFCGDYRGWLSLHKMTQPRGSALLATRLCMCIVAEGLASQLATYNVGTGAQRAQFAPCHLT